MDKIKITNTHWLETTKAFYRWKKTPEFEKWRKKQFLRQGGLCWYCKDYLPMTKQNVEHKTARSLGGGNNKNNLVLSCSACNREKGSKPLTQERRRVLNQQNKNLKGTYLKNKQWHDQYSENTIIDTLRNL